MAKGLVHVYTGDGKGKTTAAFGLAMRAAGHGKRVLILQFLKGGKRDSGEVLPAKKMGIDVVRFKDQVSPLFDKDVRPSRLKRAVGKAVNLTIDKLRDGIHDILILDEIITAFSAKLLSTEDLQKILDARPEKTELILTGRGAPTWLIEKADYVTEMRMIKHPFNRRIRARRGIEF
jgi:cob(I)alamin adenosyltransferase